MHEIYIINKNINNKFILNFTNNKLYEKNTLCKTENDYIHKEVEYRINSYKFEILNKNELELQLFSVENNNETYYTEDSYIYILKELYEIYKNIYLKLFLLHDNWNDQIIVDLNKKIITRIKHNDQNGQLIEYNNKKLIINWKNWGLETFIQIDDKNYIKEYSKFLLDNTSDNIFNKNFLKSSIPIYIFIHICTIQNWKDIFEDQIKYLKISGLYEESTHIYIGILGKIDLSYFSSYPKLTILYYDVNIELYEIPMINHIANISKKSSFEINILYIHTKGVRRAGNDNVIWSWRKMMEYFLIMNYKLCIKNLEYYDTLGCNTINKHCENIDNVMVNKDKNHTYHYSGNFWWSKKSYIEKLPFLQIDMSDKAFISRYKAENWILSEYPSGKFGILFQDDTNIHPYHRYVFEYYKELKIIITELK